MLFENSRGDQPIDENALQVWKGREVVKRCDSTPLGLGSYLGRIHSGSKLWYLDSSVVLLMTAGKMNNKCSYFVLFA